MQPACSYSLKAAQRYSTTKLKEKTPQVSAHAKCLTPRNAHKTQCICSLFQIQGSADHPVHTGTGNQQCSSFYSFPFSHYSSSHRALWHQRTFSSDREAQRTPYKNSSGLQGAQATCYCGCNPRIMFSSKYLF